jgi:hypothetical protein
LEDHNAVGLSSPLKMSATTCGVSDWLGKKGDLRLVTSSPAQNDIFNGLFVKNGAPQPAPCQAI